MLNRDLEVNLLPYCRKNNIAVLAYSPVAQGLLSGKILSDQQLPEGDFRRTHPRFSSQNRNKVATLLESILPVARDHRTSLAQVAIAWMISRGPAPRTPCLKPAARRKPGKTRWREKWSWMKWKSLS